MYLQWGVSLFIVGLAVGSFLNVLTIRYKPNNSFFARSLWSGRSRCPHCKKTLQWFELIPLVSFALQSGKCRSCKTKLSLQYPVIELATGLLFVFIPFHLIQFFHFTPAIVTALSVPFTFYAFTCIWLFVASVFVAMVVIDLKHYLIPDELSIMLAVAGIALVVIRVVSEASTSIFQTSFITQYVLLFGAPNGALFTHFVGMLLGASVFYSIYALSKGSGMGFGDVKLAGALGLLLGWPDIVLSIALAFILGGILGSVLIAFRKKHGKDRLPFAPFLIIGTLAIFFFGTEIVRGYFQLFGA